MPSASKATEALSRDGGLDMSACAGMRVHDSTPPSRVHALGRGLAMRGVRLPRPRPPAALKTAKSIIPRIEDVRRVKNVHLL